MITKIKKFFYDFKNINKINSLKPKIIFYSENKSYQKYGYNLIEYLSKKFPGKVYYISSDIDDKINDLDIINVHIGGNFLLQYFFTSLRTDNLFMTLTDLNNSIIKKNNYVKNYIYYFHGAVSTTKVFTEKAFDNYDTILCNGNYHFDEIRQREQLENLKKKKLIKSGFLYFDYLNDKKKNFLKKSDEILVAPSWDRNKKNFINEDFENIIKNLLKLNYKVRFRPHPETIKRFPEIKDIYKNICVSKNFIFDDSPDNLSAMNDSKCLITDNSGISIEFLLVFKKPIIFYDRFEKIHNPKFSMYQNLDTIEEKIKKKFGTKFSQTDISNLEAAISESFQNFDISSLNVFINENFYNYGNTIDYIDENFLDICI